MEKKTRNRTTQEQKREIIELWTSGAGKVNEIAKTMNMPTSTVYGVLYRSGIWPGYDNYAAGIAHLIESREQNRKAEDVKAHSQPKVVDRAEITMIRGPKRSLWQRIREFFQ
jgi:transposase-like protein